MGLVVCGGYPFWRLRAELALKGYAYVFVVQPFDWDVVGPGVSLDCLSAAQCVFFHSSSVFFFHLSSLDQKC